MHIGSLKITLSVAHYVCHSMDYLPSRAVIHIFVGFTQIQ